MNRGLSSSNEHGIIRRSAEVLGLPAKILGVTILSGGAGYGVAKAVEMFVTVEPNEVFEVSVVAAAALLGEFVAGEVLER